MTLLLTGATGSIGRAVLSRLVREGYHVRAISRRTQKSNPRVDWYRGDVETVDWWRALSGCDAVIHLAGVAHRSSSDVEIRRVNVAATERLLQAASDARVRPERFIYASSVAVYGVREGQKCDEDTPLRPRGAYGVAKVDAERCVVDRGGIALRLPACYGPGALGGVATLIRAVQAGLVKKDTLPDVPRSLLATENAGRAFLAALMTGKSGAFNVTDDFDLTLSTLVSWIIEDCGQTQPRLRVFEPLSRASVRALLYLEPRVPFLTGAFERIACMLRPLTFDCDKARKQLGYVPTKALRGRVMDAVRSEVEGAPISAV